MKLVHHLFGLPLFLLPSIFLSTAVYSKEPCLLMICQHIWFLFRSSHWPPLCLSSLCLYSFFLSVNTFLSHPLSVSLCHRKIFPLSPLFLPLSLFKCPSLSDHPLLLLSSSFAIHAQSSVTHHLPILFCLLCLPLFILSIESIGVSQVNTIIQVSGIQFYSTSSAHCVVCSATQVKSHSIHDHLSSHTFLQFPGITTLLSVSMSFLYLFFLFCSIPPYSALCPPFLNSCQPSPYLLVCLCFAC